MPQQYKGTVDSWEAAYSLTITATQVCVCVVGGCPEMMGDGLPVEGVLGHV